MLHEKEGATWLEDSADFGEDCLWATDGAECEGAHDSVGGSVGQRQSLADTADDAHAMAET